MKYKTLALTIGLAFSTAAWAQSIAGKWAGIISVGEDKEELYLNFNKWRGATFTGKACKRPTSTDCLDISGTVIRDYVRFSYYIPDKDRTISALLKVEDDRMTGSFNIQDVGEGTAEFTRLK